MCWLREPPLSGVWLPGPRSEPNSPFPPQVNFRTIILILKHAVDRETDTEHNARCTTRDQSGALVFSWYQSLHDFILLEFLYFQFWNAELWWFFDLVIEAYSEPPVTCIDYWIWVEYIPSSKTSCNAREQLTPVPSKRQDVNSTLSCKAGIANLYFAVPSRIWTKLRFRRE